MTAATAVPRYRVRRLPDGSHEPQMLYNCGPKALGRRWFPLLPSGYWAEPDAYSYGVITVRSPLPTREDALRAVERARLINADRPIVAEAAAAREEAAAGAPPRFFLDHGVIHDRTTGRHVTTDEDSPFCDGVAACCALLNELAAGAIKETQP
jgi:hypothetical protein